jgi:RNA polymerase sigma-70 factor (ECF subfamily)
MEPDSALLERLARGDARAFDAIYAEHRPRVYSFLVRLSGRRDVAEDLLQETFLRLATRAGSLRPDTRIGAWLYTVARNLFLDDRRSRVVDRDKLTELRAVGREEGGVSPFEALAATEAERALEHALAALPLAQREVLLLVAVEKMSPAEVATMLGATAETVRQRLSRARAMLAEALEPSQRRKEA